MIFMPDHPRANVNGFVREHWLVWEKANGRHVLPTEVIHHVNGIKDDNRPENLIVLVKTLHDRMHKTAEDRCAKHSARMKELWASGTFLKKPIVRTPEYCAGQSARMKEIWVKRKAHT